MNDQPAKSGEQLPGKGLLGWLGRQVGYIAKAVKSDVSAEAPKTIYRNSTTEEKPLPNDPAVKLRRTVIDEVVVDQRNANGKSE